MNLLNDEPPLPEPWSEDDQRPICYLFAFTARECKWNGKNVHDHPHFGKFFDAIIGMYPQYPDLSDYDEIFQSDHFAPPRRIRCDGWARPQCSYTPNECSPEVTDVKNLKGFCGEAGATTGMYIDTFDRCWACPMEEEDCSRYIGNCYQECFSYEGSGCYGSECQSYTDTGSTDIEWDATTDPSSDPGSDPGLTSPSGSESEWGSFEVWSGQKRCDMETFDSSNYRNKLRCGRLSTTPRSATPEECTQECADEQHCQYAIWHSGKYINENEPDLPEPWTRTDTRPVCYLYSFASRDGCKWDGYEGHGCPSIHISFR